MCGKPENVESRRKGIDADQDDYMDYIMGEGKYAPHSEAKRDPITWVDVAFFAVSIALVIGAGIAFFS
jgi:hypothetical protein